MQIKIISSTAEARAVVDDVALLFRHCFARELDLQRWSQLYFYNPYGDPVIALGYDEDTLIGYSGMVPQQLLGRYGESYPYWLSISLMLHPQYREGFASFYELFGSITNAAKERKIPFLLAFPNANSFLLLKHCFGWKLLHETELYNWQPDPAATPQAQVIPLIRFRLSDEIGHPFDDLYRWWRNLSGPYNAELINGRLSIIYKIIDPHTLMVIDIMTDDPELVAYDLGALMRHTGTEQLRISGVHARMVGLSKDQLERHTDYTLRLCYAPLISDPPPLRFSLLLSDVF